MSDEAILSALDSKRSRLVAPVGDFVTEVAESGYHWVPYATLPMADRLSPEREKSLVLTEIDTSPTRRYRRETPCSNPAIFKSFADLHTWDRDAVARFANRYGLLGSHLIASDMHPPMFGEQWPSSLAGSIRIRFDQELDWLAWSSWVHRAVTVLEFLKSKDRTSLASIIKWRVEHGKGNWICCALPSDHRTILSSGSPSIIDGSSIVYSPSETVWTGKEDVEAVARHYVASELNWWLQMMDWWKIRFVSTPRNVGRVELVPTSLIGAIILQFATAVELDAEFRQCRECNTWFKLVPTDRGIKIFCSQACKAREYRKRRTERPEAAPIKKPRRTRK